MLVREIYERYWPPLIHGYPKDSIPKATLGMFQLANDKTTIGIEVEAENYSGFTLPNKVLSDIPYVWHEKPEPSLRNRGIEFVTGAISGVQVGHALNLLDQMNKNGNLVYTDLAGLHIHLNVRNFTIEQVVNLVMLYIVFEDSLYRVSGNRKNSIYCLPARTCDSGLHRLVLNQDLIEACRRANKYMGFNYGVIKSYGSIEFRHSVGSSNVYYILKWINTLLRLHNATTAWDMEQLKTTIFNLNTNSEYVNFARSVFQSEVEWLNVPGLAKEMEDGVSVLKEWQISSHINNTKILDRAINTRRNKPRKELVAPLALQNNPLQWNMLPQGGILIMDDIINQEVAVPRMRIR